MKLLQKNDALKRDLRERDLWREFNIRADEAFRRNKRAGQCRAAQTAMAEMASLGKVPLAWVDRVGISGQSRKRTAKVIEAEKMIEQIKRETAERLKKNEAEVRVVKASLDVDPENGGVVDPLKSGAVDVEWNNTFGGKRSKSSLDDARWALDHQTCKSVRAIDAPSPLAFLMFREMKKHDTFLLDVMKMVVSADLKKSDVSTSAEDEFRGTTEYNVLEKMARVK